MKQFALTVGLFLLLFFSFTTLVRYNLPHMNTPDPIKSVADDSKIAETEKNDLTLLLGGDVMLGRMVAQTSEKNSGGVYPFVKISDLTKSADIIAGHHPHWVQNVSCFDMSGNLVEGNCDLKNNKLVYYSLGNLVFDQM